MNAITPAPLREGSAVVVNDPEPRRLEIDHLPADPTRILAQPLPSPTGRYVLFRNIGIVAAGLLVAELLLPLAVKPSVVIGDAVARYHYRTMTVINDKELELKEQAAIAERHAEVEAERARWAGLCSLGALIDPQIAYKCRQIADQAFDAAAESARNSRRN